MSCNDPCADGILINIDSAAQGPAGPPGPVADVINYEFVLMAGDTIISGTDNSAKEFTYNPDSLQVFINGVLLSETDYTATDGTSIILNEAAANNNDLAQITTQVPPEGYDPTNDFDRLKGEIDNNRNDIDGLREDVDQNTQDIEDIKNTAQNFTTRDVKVSGVSPARDRGDELQNQQDINQLFDADILSNMSRIDALETKEPDVKPDDLKNLSEAIEENAQGISDNATAIGDLAELVGDNTDDITSLQNQVNKLPPPTDISELEKDVDDISKQVGKNTLAISGHDKRIEDLENTPDLSDVENDVKDLTGRVATNEADIADLKATDAKHTGQISDLETAVGNLEAIDIPDNYAVVDDDNEFEVPQTFKDGIAITGPEALIECDKGSPLKIQNGNFSNSVVEIVRSNGSTAISLEASSHIRGVKTDPADKSSAVNVEFVQDLVGDNDHTHDDYATKVELKTEEQARILGDQLIAQELEDAITTQKYDDTAVNNKIDQEVKDRKSADSSLDHKISLEAQYRTDADANLQDQIDALEIPAVDPSLYATVVAMEQGDADTLAAAKEYTDAIEIPEVPELPENLATTEDVAAAVEGLASEEWTTEQIKAIDFPAGTVVDDDPPEDAEEGDLWFDTTRLELFVRYQNAWVTTSPLGVRIDEAEAVQRQIIDQVSDSISKQETIALTVAERGRKQDALVVTTKMLVDKVDQLEGAVGSHSYIFASKGGPVAAGEFALQDNGTNPVNTIAAAEYIVLAFKDRHEMDVDLGRIQEGDVLRLYDISRNQAELRITAISTSYPSCKYFRFEKISGDIERLSELPYDLDILSSFDPEGLATIDYVDAQVETKLSKSGDKMSGVLNMDNNYIANVRNPGSGTDAVNRNHVDNHFLQNSGEQKLKSSSWKIRAPHTTEGGHLSFIDIHDNEIRLYHVADPTDAHHAVPLIYLEENYAGLKKANTFTDTQTYQKSSYFQNTVISNGKNNDTITEIRGDNEDLRQLYHKIRGTNKVSWLCYPGQENSGYKRCLEMWWDADKGNPQVNLSYLTDPTQNGDAVNLRTLNREIAKIDTGSDGAKAKSGTTTPSLETGEMFFNTSDKILYIGE